MGCHEPGDEFRSLVTVKAWGGLRDDGFKGSAEVASEGRRVDGGGMGRGSGAIVDRGDGTAGIEPVWVFTDAVGVEAMVGRVGNWVIVAVVSN